MQLDHYLAHCPFLSVKRQIFLFEKIPMVLGSADIPHVRTISAAQLTNWKFPQKIIPKIIAWFKNTDEKRLATRLHETDVRCVSLHTSEYPKLLQHIFDPPPVLFMRGAPLSQTAPTLAVVGSRHNTTYGKRVTEQFVSELSNAGITIVSGLAFGIDSIAHHATLKANGTTWAILGGGVDQNHIYPTEQTTLAKEIIYKGGVLISEYPPNTHPTIYTFPARNRIIAGSTIGTVVIEATEKSGALITASAALEQGREVLTIPHSLYAATSYGPHQLIKQGARLVTSTTDILEAINVTPQKQHINNILSVALSPIETELFHLVNHEPRHINDIIRSTTHERSIIMSTLTIMELKGLIQPVGNQEYARKQ